MVRGPWTEDTILRALWRHLTAHGWAVIPQVAVTPTNGTVRRIDLLAVRTRPGKPVETLAVEAKISRADFLADVRHPEKQEPWRRAATRHTYAVPAGLVADDEVPETSGLLTVKHGGTGSWGDVEWSRRAPYPTSPGALPSAVFLALCQRAGHLEAHTRGWNTGPDAAGTPQELRAALTAAHAATGRQERRADRAEGVADAWRAAYALAAPDGHPCRWCDRPVKPLHPGRDGGFRSWRHRDPDDDAPCQVTERYQVESTARDAYTAAGDTERGRRLRQRTRWSPVPEVYDADPWRAFLPGDHVDYEPTGPAPADVLPAGVAATS